MAETALQYIWERYADLFITFAERTDFERVLGVVDNAVNSAVSDDTGVLAKLMVLSDVEEGIKAFADFYKKHIPANVVNNLAEDLRWVVEKARETATVLWLEGQRKDV
ncbi:MAG: hypothetical protein QW756_01105 [Nitrososphaerota archaeon]